MDVVLTHWAGLDVHQKTVMACRVTPDPWATRRMGSWRGGHVAR
jgi:hypothetical protein